jgi:spore cortex biosynthesis protein YabQ
LILNELSKFLFFVLIGLILGIIFDVFRIIRKCFKNSDLITYIQDIIFILIAAIILLLGIFIINNGEVRAYLFFGIIIGILLYFITISKYFVNLSSKIILFIKKVIFKPIFDFIRKLLKKIREFMIKIKQFMSKLIKIDVEKLIKNRKTRKKLTNFNK